MKGTHHNPFGQAGEKSKSTTLDFGWHSTPWPITEWLYLAHFGKANLHGRRILSRSIFVA